MNQGDMISSNNCGSKKSPTGPTERTSKPENLIALAASNFLRGPLVRSHSIFDGVVVLYANSSFLPGL